MSKEPLPRTIGGYVLEAKIGQGGMGAVYRAHHPLLAGRKVALKVLLGDGPPAARAIARFERETQALAAITAHPNIVPLHASGVDGARPYYVMELVLGVSLGALCDGKPLEATRAARLVRAIADAIAHVHSHGILHRDLKPENVLVETGDRPRVCDFGMAWIAGSERLTRTGALLGTPLFASPEQLEGRSETADARSDVYAIGALLFYALTGHPPFAATTLLELLDLVATTPAPPPSRDAPGVPAALDAVVARALATAPGDRYQTAVEMRDDLDRFLAGGRVSARAPSRADGLERALRRKDVRLALASAALVVAVVGATLALEARRESRDRAAEARRFREGIELPFAEAMTPGEGLARIKEVLALLVKNGAPEDRLAEVRQRLAARELEEEVAALEGRTAASVPASALERLAAAAIAAPSSANLVGERPGLAVGDALLDGRDALLAASAPDLSSAVAATASGLVLDASRLAALRLERAGPDDAAAHALRAYARLAAMDAPRRPLGPGRLGLEAATRGEIRADLEAARAVGGAAGARAAWLLVDLLVSAGPAGEADARAALAAARTIAPEAIERWPLERVLALEAKPAAAVPLLAALRDRDLRASALELSRLLARLGAPDALEHPELASGDPRAIGVALAHESPLAWAVLPLPLEPRLAEAHAHGDAAYRTLQACSLTEKERMGGSLATLAMVRERFAARRGAIVKELTAAMGLAPEDPEILGRCADAIIGRLSSPVLNLLAARHDLDAVDHLAADFCFRDRSVSRAGFSQRPLTERWESPGTGEAACREFDERLREDVRTDEPLEAGRAAGLPALAIEQACQGASGLRCLEELSEQTGLDAAERDRLAVSALVSLEAIARLGGPAVLPFRARLRRLVFPEPLGRSLAALDLRRCYRVGRAGQSPLVSYGQFLIVAGAQGAGDAPGEAAVLRSLYDLGIAWTHEEALARLFRAGRATPSDLEIELQGRSSDFAMKDYLAGLRKVVAPEAVALDLAPTAEDRRRIAARSYDPRPPGDSSKRP